MSTEQGYSGGDRKLSLEPLMHALGITPDELAERMLQFNSDAEEPIKSPGTIEKMAVSGVSLNRTNSVSFAYEFVQHTLETHDDLDLQMIADLISTLETTHKRLQRKSSPSSSSSQKRPPATRLLDFIQSSQSENRHLGTLQERIAGNYILVRKTSSFEGDHFYEEPLYVGNFDEDSWLLSNKHGVNIGFTSFSNGIFTTILAHPDPTRIFGFRVIMGFFAEQQQPEFVPGVAIRFSDDQRRPSASRVLIRRANVDQTTLQRWADCASDGLEGGSVHQASGFTSRVERDDVEYALYTELQIGQHVKSHEADEWEKICKENGISFS